MHVFNIYTCKAINLICLFYYMLHFNKVLHYRKPAVKLEILLKQLSLQYPLLHTQQRLKEWSSSGEKVQIASENQVTFDSIFKIIVYPCKDSCIKSLPTALLVALVQRQFSIHSN